MDLLKCCAGLPPIPLARWLFLLWSWIYYSLPGKKPLLLLDDIFDKLDQQRIEKLLDMICNETFGQILLTEARADRVENFFTNFRGEMRKFQIQEGKVLI